MSMISTFINNSIKKARYEKLKDGTYYGDIKGLQGLWANAKTQKECKAEMREALEEWIAIKIRHGDPVPGLTLGSAFSKKLCYA
jgi:predicted RNase H-like HicB family nuclease